MMKIFRGGQGTSVILPGRGWSYDHTRDSNDCEQ